MSKRTWLSSAFFAFATAAQGANFEIRPVTADAPFVLSGDEIFLPQGLLQPAVVTFDVFVSGWSPELLRGAAFTRLVTGGTSGNVTPYNPACASDAACDTLVGPFGDCNFVLGCGFGFFQNGRPDFIFAGLPIVTGSNLTYAGLTTNPGLAVSDPGIAKYLASFKMLTAPNSDGTFHVSFDLTGAEMYWFNDNENLFLPTVTPAKVTFNSHVVLGIPAMGTWGLFVMALSLACAGSIRAVRVRAQTVAAV